MKIIGYMQGTDPQVLTQLLLEGYETYPLSNVFDNHGKNITLVTTEDHISLVVGYLHKFIPVAPQFTMTDILLSVKVYKIPVIIIVPKEIHDKAHQSFYLRPTYVLRAFSKGGVYGYSTTRTALAWLRRLIASKMRLR